MKNNLEYIESRTNEFVELHFTDTDMSHRNYVDKQKRSVDKFVNGLYMPSYKQYAIKKMLVDIKNKYDKHLEVCNNKVDCHINDGYEDMNYFLDQELEKIEDEIEKEKQNANLTTSNINLSKEKTKVFIVHGHNNEVKQEVARFIERLKLTPIILHEQANESMTVIEKIEKYSDEVAYGIILYTACDFGGTNNNEKIERPRARQNVVFEHGYLMAKLERKNTCALLEKGVETPSDFSGVVYVPLDSAWRLTVAKELKNVGYEIDMNVLV